MLSFYVLKSIIFNVLKSNHADTNEHTIMNNNYSIDRVRLNLCLNIFHGRPGIQPNIYFKCFNIPLLSLPLLFISPFSISLSLFSLSIPSLSPSFSLSPSPPLSLSRSLSLSLYIYISFSYFVVFILADYSAIYSLSLYIYPLSSLSGFHRWLNIF